MTRLPAQWITVVLLVCSTVAWGQTDTTNAEEPKRSRLEEQVEVRLVQIPVLARDRKGRAVTDLTAEEMAVKVDGDKMRVAFLDRVSVELDDEPLPEVKLKVNAPGGWEAQGEEGPSGGVRYFAIFVDLENDTKLGRPDSMRQAFRFVEERLAPTDRVAVLSYNGELTLEAPFSGSREMIRAGIERAYSRPVGRYLDLTRRILDLVEVMELCQTDASSFVGQADEQCIKDSAYEYAEQMRPRAENYVNALDGVVRYMSGLRGRKTVLALSHGIAAEPTDDILGAARAIYGNTPAISQLLLTLTLGEGARVDMDRLTALAVEHDVTLHFVDRNPQPTADGGARRYAAFQPGERPILGAHVAAQADIEQVARNTGGVLVKSTDVFKGMSEVMALEQGAYMLGYYLDRWVSQKKLNKASVSTSRGGVKLSHQRGFFRQPRAKRSTSGIPPKILLGRPLSLAEDGRPGQFIPFEIVADPKRIGYEVDARSASSTFSLHVQLSMADGRPLRDSYHLIQHAYPRDLWDREDVAPVTISGWLELPPGEYTLGAYMRNPSNDREGRLELPVQVPGT